MMDTLKKYWPQILGTIGMVTPAVGWVSNKIIEGAKNDGKLEAKEEINEDYNNALRDAIVYRAKWESCCTDETE